MERVLSVWPNRAYIFLTINGNCFHKKEVVMPGFDGTGPRSGSKGARVGKRQGKGRSFGKGIGKGKGGKKGNCR
jgi:hypothetical protein